ncbi:MAG: ABC-type transporter Mla MlaB component [Candidatus Azotimanducaceae bacterium]|jgi:ABC-type transporter Mla MlaB component
MSDSSSATASTTAAALAAAAPAAALCISDNRLRVSGCLSVNSVAGYQRDGIKLIDSLSGPVVIDLAEADVQGSAAIALLIAWQRHITHRQGEVRMIGASATLREIARACGVDDILAFADV